LGALVIIDVPDPLAAPAIAGIVAASGAVKDIKFFRLLSQEEVVEVLKKAAKLRKSYKPPAK
jgi:hypothetical protein